MINNKIEILSPAGSEESAKAAIACGADAIYLGMKKLGARQNATNFDSDELKKIVAYSHAYGAKVCLTLNILVYDKEMDEVISAINEAAQAGVDAFIIQDLAVAELAKEIAPHIERYASTQLVIHNVYGAKMAKELGFKRAVLARELTKSEIMEITKSGYIETEVFLHGALCMSISGQCYLSSMIGERSGNRGLCAQPCRLPFAVKGGNSHALSLKDLSVVEQINELADMGVTCVKIEGRMKRPEYVAAATKAAYDAREGKTPDTKTLKSIFSRSGFTDGYYNDKIDGEMFGTRQKEDVVAANSVMSELATLYRNPLGRVGIKLYLSAKNGEQATLTATDSDGNTAISYGEVPEIAINAPTTMERAAENLAKLGGTPFFAESIDGEIGSGLIIPASKLNALRRECVDKLRAMREEVKAHHVTSGTILKYSGAKNSEPPKCRVRLSSFKQITPELIKTAEAVIMPLSMAIKYLPQMEEVLRRKVWAELPGVDFRQSNTKDRVQSLIAEGIEHFVVGNIGEILLCKELSAKYIHGSFRLNVFNQVTADILKNMGLCDIEASFELSLPKAMNLQKAVPTGMVAFGYLPLMTFRNCPIKANIGCDNCKGFSEIIDRRGTVFYIDCVGGRAKLYNSLPLYLADRQAELLGFEFITLNFTKENANEVNEILAAYKNGSAPTRDITRGLYYRNVK